MIIKNMGAALRYCIPQSVGKKLGEYWELMKPLIDFKYEVIESRMNSMFELATIDEIGKGSMYPPHLTFNEFNIY